MLVAASNRESPTVRPFLRWAGSKTKLLGQLQRYWPGGSNRYVEPFMGSAALFFRLQPDGALLADLNSELVATFRASRDHPRAVYNRLRRIPVGKRSFLRQRALAPDQLDDLDRAARFIFLNRFCFNGLYRTNRDGQFNVPFSNSRTGGIPNWEEFRAASARLQSADIVCGDFQAVVVQKVRSGDFVYLDPPYAVSNRRVFRQYGARTFDTSDLARLSATLKVIHDRGARFLLSYAFCTESIHEFSAWHQRKVFTQRNISGFSSHRRLAAELMISNVVPEAL